MNKIVNIFFFGITLIFFLSTYKYYSSNNNIDVKKSIRSAEKFMKGQGRILVRASGTESKIRVMGESENNKLLQKCLNIISKKIK